MDIGEPQKVEVDGETYYYTDNVLMELWNAKRYCQALGRQGKGTGQMVSLSELGCTATAKTVDCSGSALIKKLQEKNAGRRALWTKPSDDSENSCKAYVIVPGSNRDFYQESGGFDTLCK